MEVDTDAPADRTRPPAVDILLVDADTQYLIELVDRLYRDADELTVYTSKSVAETIGRIEDEAIDCLVCTYGGASAAGIEVLDYLRERSLSLPVVVLPEGETTIIDSRNLVADVSAVFRQDEATREGVLAPHISSTVAQHHASLEARRQTAVRTLLGELAREVAGAADREAIESAVTERIDATPTFDAGWLGEVDPKGAGLDLRRATDDDIAPQPDDPIVDAARRAVAFDQVQVTTRENRSYAVIPVEHEGPNDEDGPDNHPGPTDQVLAVFSDDRHAFSPGERRLLAELGSTVARSIAAVMDRTDLETRVESLEPTAQLVDRLAVGVVVYDEAGRLVEVNEAFATLHDADAGALSRAAAWDVRPDLDADTFEAHWRETADAEARVAAVEIEREDGSARPVDLVTTRTTVDGDPVNACVAIDRRALAPAAQGGEERMPATPAQEAPSATPGDPPRPVAADAPTAIDDETAETIAYELREWLTYAQHASDDVDDARLDAVVDRLGEVLEGDLRREGWTVEDPAAHDLAAVAREAWELVIGDGRGSQITGHRAVVADRNLLRRLFEDLFRHVRNRTDGDSVSVQVGLREDGLFVRDTGGATGDQGAPEGVAGAARAVDPAVARRACAAHGWTLDVDPTPDGGTRFVVSGVEVTELADD